MGTRQFDWMPQVYMNKLRLVIWELRMFFGKEGNIHKEELRLIVENFNFLENLETYQFLSPKAKVIYQKLVELGKNK